MHILLYNEDGNDNGKHACHTHKMVEGWLEHVFPKNRLPHDLRRVALCVSFPPLRFSFCWWWVRRMESWHPRSFQSAFCCCWSWSWWQRHFFGACWICPAPSKRRDTKEPLLLLASCQLFFWCPLIGPNVCVPHWEVGKWLPYRLIL